MRFRPLLIPLAAWVFNCANARAADWYTGSESTQTTDFGASVDSSLSATSQGDSHLSTIGTIAPFTKLDQSGLRFSIGGDVGDYNYRSAALAGPVRGREEDGSVLAGWEWVGQNVNLTARAGFEVRNDELDRFDPDNVRPGTQAGAKIEAEVYANPTPYTMAFAQASYSTVRQAYFTHAKWGFAVADGIFVGPEALFLGDAFYQQWRVGAHVSGVRVGLLQFGLAGGFVDDRSRGAGAYGDLDLRIAF